MRITKFLFATLLLASAAGAQQRSAPRLDFKLAEARAFNNYRESWDLQRQGAPCLVERATGRRVCKTMPQWRKLAARLAAEERAGGR